MPLFLQIGLSIVGVFVFVMVIVMAIVLSVYKDGIDS